MRVILCMCLCACVELSPPNAPTRPRFVLRNASLASRPATRLPRKRIRADALKRTFSAPFLHFHEVRSVDVVLPCGAFRVSVCVRVRARVFACCVFFPSRFLLCSLYFLVPVTPLPPLLLSRSLCLCVSAIRRCGRACVRRRRTHDKNISLLASALFLRFSVSVAVYIYI